MSLAELLNTAEENTWSTDFSPSVRYYHQDLITTGISGGINGSGSTAGATINNGTPNTTGGSTAYLDIVPEKPIFLGYKAGGSVFNTDYDANLKLRLWDDRSYRFLERRRAADPYPVMLDTAAINLDTSYGKLTVGKATSPFGAAAHKKEITPGAGSPAAGQKLQAGLSMSYGNNMNATLALTNPEHDVRRPTAVSTNPQSNEGHHTLTARPNIEASISTGFSTGYGVINTTVELLNGKGKSIVDIDNKTNITEPTKVTGLGLHVDGEFAGFNIFAGATNTEGVGAIYQSQDTHFSATNNEGARKYNANYFGAEYGMNLLGYDTKLKAKRGTTRRTLKDGADTFAKENEETSFGITSQYGEDSSMNISYSKVHTLNAARAKTGEADVVSAGFRMKF